MSAPSARRILVSGASIAGPALAYWLHRYGFEVTVVERAGAPRGGGYPIDIRGTAIEVVERMGLLPQLREAHIDTRRITYLDVDGSVLGSVRPEEITGGVQGRDVEVPRGDLGDALYTAVREGVRFRFDDSITDLHDDGAGVDVTFRSGEQDRFDLVVGADGLHSSTRSLAFGPEEQFHHDLGRCFAGFTMPNDLGLAHEGVMWNTPGRGAVLYAPRTGEVLHAFLTFARPDPPFAAFRTPDAQCDLVASVFADAGWEVPRMVEAMRAADDLFFDVVSQIRMPGWSRGRVVLVGDAAYAPSFLSGQGTSIALVGAYVLAGELASTVDHAAALAAYERRMRGFVETNQGIATAGGTFVAPGTAAELALRNEALRNEALRDRAPQDRALREPAEMPGDELRAANTALLALPAYA